MPAIALTTAIPGPLSQALVARRAAAAPRGTPILTPIAVAQARGSTVTDLDGNTFLDFAGGIGALAVGHCPTGVINAIETQANALLHMCAIVATYEPFVEVGELLNALAPGDFPKKTTLVNSGAEAVETAVKIARAYTKRQAVIVFEGAYHGRTNLTMAMTSKYSLFKLGFGPFAPEIYRLPFPNLRARPATLSEDEFVDAAIAQLEHSLVAQVAPEAIAAIVIEPVQGEGGFIPTPPRFLRRIRELCTAHGIVMVADEIQCGFGRTGKLFAVEHYGVIPDLLVTGKSIAAGLPLAAVTGRAEIMDGPHPGGLGGTYSGNPLACAAAVEAIKTINAPTFLARATDVGTRLRTHLEKLKQKHPTLIGDVRGLGPMLAIEIVDEQGQPDADATAAINAETLQRGLITIRAGLYANCVRFLPPLTISDAEINEAMAVLAEALDVVASRR
jgi:4-aminobutyrate aminotransferase/(S)-3-amino-2-methylpropionate transaminase